MVAGSLDTELDLDGTPGLLQLGLLAGATKLLVVLGVTLEFLPSWFIKQTIVSGMLGKLDRIVALEDRDRFPSLRPILPKDKDFIGVTLSLDWTMLKA